MLPQFVSAVASLRARWLVSVLMSAISQVWPPCSLAPCGAAGGAHGDAPCTCSVRGAAQGRRPAPPLARAEQRSVGAKTWSGIMINEWGARCRPGPLSFRSEAWSAAPASPGRSLARLPLSHRRLVGLAPPRPAPPRPDTIPMCNTSAARLIERIRPAGLAGAAGAARCVSERDQLKAAGLIRWLSGPARWSRRAGPGCGPRGHRGGRGGAGPLIAQNILVATWARGGTAPAAAFGARRAISASFHCKSPGPRARWR